MAASAPPVSSPTPSTEAMQMESRFVALNNNEFFNKIGETTSS
jgi:hypothetical protein